MTGFSLKYPSQPNNNTITTTTTTNNPSIRRIWGTIDEIVNKHEILGYKIDPFTYKVFYQTPVLMHLKNENNEILDNPSIMFLCKVEEGTNVYQNVYDDTDIHLANVQEPSSDQNNTLEKGIFSLIDDRIEHPILGNFYIFSINPIDFQALPIFNIRRFVGFLRKPTYILKNLSTIKTESVEQSYTLGSVIPNIVSYFSPDKPEEPVEPAEIDQAEGEQNEGKNVELDEIDQNTQELANISNLKTSCIYFQEHINGINIPFWCIKSTLDFAEI